MTFNVGQDRRTNQFFARNILSVDKPSVAPPPPPTAVKRYRGVVSTMKDSFGFIERDDVLKEIFFHITEFGSDIPTNTIQLGVEVEFDIQNRLVKEIIFSIDLFVRFRIKTLPAISLFSHEEQYNSMKLTRHRILVEFYNHYKFELRKPANF